MYYQNYEDYMRSVLGYPIQSDNTYEVYSQPYNTMPLYTNSVQYSNEIMNLYPEIYKIVNPMVCKICEVNTSPITKELIDQMTEEIYLNLEVQPETDTVVNVRVNTSKSGAETEEKHRDTRNVAQAVNNRVARENQNKDIQESRETVSRSRRPNNRFLQDLIRILILNQLLGGNRPLVRPRIPPRPPARAPFPREGEFYENYLRY